MRKNVIEIKDFSTTELYSSITIGGIITDQRIRTAENGRQSGFLKVTDRSGTVDLAFFGDNLDKFSRYFGCKNPIWVEGTLARASFNRQGDDDDTAPALKLRVKAIGDMLEYRERFARRLEITEQMRGFTRAKMKQLSQLLEDLLPSLSINAPTGSDEKSSSSSSTRIGCSIVLKVNYNNKAIVEILHPAKFQPTSQLVDKIIEIFPSPAKVNLVL